jgi:hypothetical protein
VRELQAAMGELRKAHDELQLEAGSPRSRLAMADARAQVQAGAVEQDRVKVKAAVQAARAASNTAAERALGSWEARSSSCWTRSSSWLRPR